MKISESTVINVRRPWLRILFMCLCFTFDRKARIDKKLCLKSTLYWRFTFKIQKELIIEAMTQNIQN